MGKLQHIKRQLDGAPSKEILIDQLFESLFQLVHKNSQTLSGDVQARLLEMKDAIREIQASSEKNSDVVLEKLASGINKTLNSFAHGHNRATVSLINRVGAIEDKLVSNQQSVGEQIDKTILDSVKRIEKGISSIPEADLKGVTDVLVELSTKEPDLKQIIDRLDKPKEWEFEFVYLGKKIDKVIATEVI